MELTYRIRGTDGQEYGPATLSQIQGWTREGRIGPDTEVTRSDMNHWAPLNQFQELAEAHGGVATMPPPATAGAAISADAATEGQLKSGASWFYWIAALSLVNSFSALSGADWRFFLGLGITQVFDAFGEAFGGAAKIVVLCLDLLAAGLFVLFGVFAYKRHQWAFIAGMIFFGLDGLISLVGQDWVGLGFHAFALFCLWRGFQACRALVAR